MSSARILRLGVAVAGGLSTAILATAASAQTFSEAACPEEGCPEKDTCATPSADCPAPEPAPPPPAEPVVYEIEEPVDVKDDSDFFAGVALTIGGGVTGFVDGTLDDQIPVGGSWDVRALFGSRSLLAFEMAYIGSAQEVDTFGVGDDAFMVSNGAEGDLRFNFMPDTPWQPYVFSGGAWRRYDMTDNDENFSDISGTDDVFEIPLGGGIAWYFDQFVLDARAQYRWAFDNDLTRGELGDDDNEIDRWGVSANLGYEF